MRQHFWNITDIAESLRARCSVFEFPHFVGLPPSVNWVLRSFNQQIHHTPSSHAPENKDGSVLCATIIINLCE